MVGQLQRRLNDLLTSKRATRPTPLAGLDLAIHHV